MNEFYDAKIRALIEERQSSIDSLKSLIEKADASGCRPVDVQNIIHHATVLMQVTSEIDAYEMSKHMNAIHEAGLK